MPPRAPITYSKKGRKGSKLVSSVSSARLHTDAGPSKRCLPRSVSAADIRHPHLDHYTSFDPIDEAVAPDLATATAGYCRDTAAERTEESLRWGASQGDQGRFPQDDELSQAPTHGKAIDARKLGHGSHSTARPKHLPSSKTSDFDFLSPRPAPLPRSMTAALPTPPICAELPSQPLSDPAHTYYDPDVVNNKVAAMLAATEVLKPEAPASGTKTQMMKNKVLSRVTSLFGRRLSRKSTKDSIKGTDSKFDMGSIDPYPTTLQRSRSPSANPPYIPDKDMETRVEHPQRPTEHKIPRKPVPNNGRHLQAHYAKTHGSPLVPGITIYPTSIDSGGGGLDSPAVGTQSELYDWPGMHDEYEAGDCAESLTKITDPFESELSFDNLEGFLTTQPVASSTPRDRGSYGKDPTINNSPSRNHFHLPGRLSHFAENEARNVLTSSDGKSFSFREKPAKRPAKPALRLHRGSENMVLDIDGTEPKRTKIHPSPSKASLEELSRQFRALSPESVDQDELAMNDAGHSQATGTATFPRNTVRLPASQISVLSTADYHDFIRANAKSSSIPRSTTTGGPLAATPLLRAPSSRRARRMGEVVLPCRPLARGSISSRPARPPSHDLDELQWDDETYRRQLRST